ENCGKGLARSPPSETGSPRGWRCGNAHGVRRHGSHTKYTRSITIIAAIGDIRLDALTAGHIDDVSREHAAHRQRNRGVPCTWRPRVSVAQCDQAWPPRLSCDPRRATAAPIITLIETLTRDEVTQLINNARGDPLEGAYLLAVTLGMR